jgi:hypothetical protein
MARHVIPAHPSREREGAVGPRRQSRSLTVAARTSIDWRGWIALAWVVFWGCAYVLTAYQARAPQILGGIRVPTRTAARLAGHR